jgi:hypothetical protein
MLRELHDLSTPTSGTENFRGNTCRAHSEGTRALARLNLDNYSESRFAAEEQSGWAEGLDPCVFSSQRPRPSQFHSFYLVSALPCLAFEETRLHSEKEFLTLNSNTQ